MKKQLLFAILVVFASCTSSNEDIVQSIDKKGSIELEVTTKHETGFDLLITTERVWVNDQHYKTFYRVDTLPFLGNTEALGEDSTGNEVKVKLPKDYEFYITVK